MSFGSFRRVCSSTEACSNVKISGPCGWIIAISSCLAMDHTYNVLFTFWHGQWKSVQSCQNIQESRNMILCSWYMYTYIIFIMTYHKHSGSPPFYVEAIAYLSHRWNYILVNFWKLQRANVIKFDIAQKNVFIIHNKLVTEIQSNICWYTQV